MKQINIKILAIFILVCIVNVFLFGNLCASTLEDYEQQLENIKKELKENSSNLTGVEKQINEYQYEIVELDSKANEYTKKLAELQTKVDSVNEKVEGYEKDLQNASQTYNSAEDIYTTRLRVIYENGIPTIWDILFSSKGISDFFSKLNVYTSILDYDKSLVTNIKSQKEYIDYIKKDIEIQKLQLDQLKYDLEKSTQALNDTITAKQNKKAELENSKENLTKIKAALESKQKEAQQKINEEIARIEAEANKNPNAGTSFTGSDFVWPVSGFTTITTRFGEIYNLVVSTGSAHTGCDVAGSGILGKPIKAIQSGVVTTARYGNYGYGNYVIINHGTNSNNGNRYISLYGHCSSLAVSVGQTVSKGQVIGYVGSTGNSTGPHLHLEVYVNGTRVDPLKFYPAIKFYFPYG